MPTALPESEVHVWATDPGAVTDPALLLSYMELLSPDERERQARFTFEPGRREHLLTRALVRTALARYLDRPARDLAFVMGEYGRPGLVDGGGLRFNLSHTTGLIACAVTRGREVGLDVEFVDRSVDLLAVGRSVFARDEFEALAALPADSRRERFFALWTLKEAYIKARGMGLALPLGAFSFDLDGSPEGIGLRFDPPLVDDPSVWRFVRMQPSPEHVAALAVNASEWPGPVVRWRTCVPLGPPDAARDGDVDVIHR